MLVFVINLLLQRISGLSNEITVGEKETKGVVLLWRDELIKNKQRLKQQ